MNLKSKSAKTCCLILGMHNSGTSLLGGLLHAAGIPMGDKLLMKNTIPEHLRPKYDYYEDKDIVRLQDFTLKALGRHWSSYKGSYPISSEDSFIKNDFRKKLAILVKKRLKKNNLWAVKDPRICIFLEDWIKVLNSYKINIKIIIVYRDPLTNINSFSDKGKVPLNWAEALWQRTYMNILSSCALISKQDISIRSFDEVINDSEKITIEICKFLGHKSTSQLRQKINNHVDISLPSKELKDSTYKLTRPTKELNEILIRKEWGSKLPSEDKLLSNQFQSVLNSNSAGLNLNSSFLNEENLYEKAKIAIVTAELQGFGLCGGIGSAYKELTNALLECGHKVYIFLIDSSEDIIQNTNNLEIIKINPNEFRRLELIREILRRLKDIKPEVIHTHEWQGFGSGLHEFCKESNSKLIIGLHGPSAWTRTGNPWPRDQNGSLNISENHLYEEGLIRALEEDAILNADLIISPSAYMKDWIKDNISPNKDVIIQRNCPLSQRFDNDQNYNLLDKSKIIYFGRFEERKGLNIFLEGLERIKSKPEIIFLGSDCYLKEGILASEIIKKKLEKIGLKYEINDNLNRENALKLIKEKNHLIIIPSIIENSPCVVEELLDTNLRVIATDTGGIKEMIIEADHQWLAKTNSIDLAKKINLALTTENPKAFLLRAKISGWKIKLSWQAFHERIPIESMKIQEKLNKTQPIFKLYFEIIKRKFKDLISRIIFQRKDNEKN